MDLMDESLVCRDRTNYIINTTEAISEHVRKNTRAACRRQVQYCEYAIDLFDPRLKKRKSMSDALSTERVRQAVVVGYIALLAQ